MSQLDLERLICAGAIDKEFGELVLSDPLRAANGYQGECFELTSEEKALLARIHANDYQTFIKIIARWIVEKRDGHLLAEEIRVVY